VNGVLARHVAGQRFDRALGLLQREGVGVHGAEVDLTGFEQRDRVAER
jgi:hypothetical protein